MPRARRNGLPLEPLPMDAARTKKKWKQRMTMDVSMRTMRTMMMMMMMMMMMLMKAVGWVAVACSWGESARRC